jgi:hypothetical protein
MSTLIHRFDAPSSTESWLAINDGVMGGVSTSRLRYDVAGTLRLTTGATVPVTEVIRVWRAPGVGGLRQTLELTTLGVSTTQTLELRAFSVNGVESGVLARQ